MKIWFVASFLLLLLACSSGYGSKLAGDKLDVYFEDASLQAKADSLGSYWTRNGLTGSRKQSIRLEKNKSGYQVKLIRSEEFKEQPSVEEMFLLQELRSHLQDSVFDKKNTVLVICDMKFNPLYEINE